MDINEYVVNTDYGTPDAGHIFFRGQFYTPQQIQEFADELTQIAGLGESYLPEEETKEYKENQAYYARVNYDSYKNLLFTIPISRYIEVWQEEVDAGRDTLDQGDWRAQDGDRLTEIKKFVKEYEAEHGISA